MIEAHCRRSSLSAQTYTERLRVGRRSQAVRVSYLPLVAVTAARARFAQGREALAGGAFGLDAGAFGGFDEQVAAAFCAPGSFVALDVTMLDVDPVLGEVRLPPNVLGAAYGELELTYTAGFADVPVAVKVACAQIVKNAQATPGLNVKSSRVDTLQMEYFSGSLLDAQVQALLRPYVAERLS